MLSLDFPIGCCCLLASFCGVLNWVLLHVGLFLWSSRLGGAACWPLCLDFTIGCLSNFGADENMALGILGRSSHNFCESFHCTWLKMEARQPKTGDRSPLLLVWHC